MAAETSPLPIKTTKPTKAGRLCMVETRDHDDDLGIRGEGKVTGLVEAVDSSEQLSPGLCNTS